MTEEQADNEWANWLKIPGRVMGEGVRHVVNWPQRLGLRLTVLVVEERCR